MSLLTCNQHTHAQVPREILNGEMYLSRLTNYFFFQFTHSLRQCNVTVRFVTNTTKESQRLLHERLIKIGFDIGRDEIFSSLVAARAAVCKLNPFLMVDDAAKEDFIGYIDTDVAPENADSVLVALAPDKFSYHHMNQAMRILHRGGQLFAIHKGRYFKSKDGLCLGPGPFVAALEHACDTSAVIIGKPSRAFFLSSFADLECSPHEVAMIGDDVNDDVIGAQSAGLIGILVKTGKYRPGDENTCTAIDYVAQSIVQAVDWILTRTSGNI